MIHSNVATIRTVSTSGQLQPGSRHSSWPGIVDDEVGGSLTISDSLFSVARRAEDRPDAQSGRAAVAEHSASLDAALAREETDQAVCLLSDEFAEGYAAFKERRAADFVAVWERASAEVDP